MRISAIETVRVDAFPNLTFVQVHTDEGITGLGETFYGAEAVEAHLHAIAAPALIGEDPLQIERHAQRLAGYVGYTGSGVETRARSAIDLALWDILGKVSGQPVYNLLGGRTRDSIDIYNTCAGSAYVNSATGQAVSNWGLKTGRYEDLEAAINRPGELATELLSQGITGMKIWPFDRFAEASGGTSISARDMGAALAPIRHIRDSVGDSMAVMVEMHSLWDVPTARRIASALEEYDPFWIEDPVRSDLRSGLARVAERTSIRVAAGETVAGLAGFEALLHEGGIGAATVDTTWSGGLTTAKHVAALSAAHGVPVAPHDCTGPVALSACTHLAVAAPNALLQETVRAGYLGWYSSLTLGGPIIDGGSIRPSDDPGLGIELAPGLRNRDGTHVRVTGMVGTTDRSGSADHVRDDLFQAHS
ncbi:mandelate racemase [Frondihabitans sucicola]|uniref:Mandelate racemase n=1 Tax=Frondihabitans sucicola TaxID=1268041 RepID=A0ABM8GIJ1_9MICO|nr:mandelate racemase/muconate lactonizing enzyme family protein [Frondihabitans sucicola]BDZ48164.1 mandelate racemase [Frondihabitans sucicola]